MPMPTFRRAHRLRAVPLAACLALTVVPVVALPAGADPTLPPVSLQPVASPYVCDTDDVRETQPGTLLDEQLRPRAVRNGAGDMAFSGDTAVVLCGGDDGDLSNDGFAVVDIADPSSPRVMSTFACAASASDVAMYGDLVFLAVDRNNDTLLLRGPLNDPTAQARGQSPCDAPIIQRPKVVSVLNGLRSIEEPLPNTDTVFQGIRVVSIADPANPRLAASLDFGDDSFGAHTLTALPDLPNDRVLVYVSVPAHPFNQILSVSLSDPSKVEVVNAKFRTGLTGCHDISFFLPRGLLACPRQTAGTMLLDVRDDADDPYDTGASLTNPVRIRRPHPDPERAAAGELVDAGLFIEPFRAESCDAAEVRAPDLPPRPPNPSDPTAPVKCPPVPSGPYGHHSAAFSSDGDTLAVTDEALSLATSYDGDPCPRGNEIDGARGHHGSVFFFDISDPAYPALLSHQLPPAADNGVCFSKQLNVLPLTDGRDVAVVSWLGGGTSVIDFTDPRQPRELATHMVDQGGTGRSYPWASYFYDGYVYVNNGFGCFLGALCEGSYELGLEVLELTGLGPTLPMDSFDFGRQTCPEGETGSAMPHCARS